MTTWHKIDCDGYSEVTLPGMTSGERHAKAPSVLQAIAAIFARICLTIPQGVVAVKLDTAHRENDLTTLTRSQNVHLSVMADSFVTAATP